MTKEEILDSKFLHSYYYPNGDTTKPKIHDQDCKFCHYESMVEEAMDEYAKQRSISFAEWVINSDYDFNDKTGMWYDFILKIEIDVPEITTEQLYNLFEEQSKHQNK